MGRRVSLFSEDVAEGVKAGDPEALGTVYLLLKDRLINYLAVRVRDRATAEDIVLSTFMELLQKGNTIRGGAAAIKVWLFRAANYNALDHLRRMSRRPEELCDDPQRLEAADASRGPEELAVASEVTERVRSALQHLSPDQRQVILMRYLGGLTAPEIARVLGKNDGAVRSLQHRGERSLARLMAEEERQAEAAEMLVVAQSGGGRRARAAPALRPQHPGG
jgi:RNA polymerase sigma-70 factor, ECF subfamily